MNVNVNTIKINQLRGFPISETISSLDASGNVTTGLKDAPEISYDYGWRTLQGKRYSGTASITANEFTFAVPELYTDPECLEMYCDFYWELTTGSKIQFATAIINIVDVHTSSANGAGFASSSYGFQMPGQAVVGLMQGLCYINGQEVTVRVTQIGVAPSEGGDVWTSFYYDGTLNAITLLYIGAEVASSGTDVIAEIYVDGVATGATVTLPAGSTTRVSQSISVGM